jgi:hypothetical protein
VFRFFRTTASSRQSRTVDIQLKGFCIVDAVKLTYSAELHMHCTRIISHPNMRVKHGNI